VRRAAPASPKEGGDHGCGGTSGRALGIHAKQRIRDRRCLASSASSMQFVEEYLLQYCIGRTKHQKKRSTYIGHTCMRLWVPFESTVIWSVHFSICLIEESDERIYYLDESTVHVLFCIQP
jgi:hypothetical protein